MVLDILDLRNSRLVDRVIVAVLLLNDVVVRDSHQPFDTFFLELIIKRQVRGHAIDIGLHLQLVSAVQSLENNLSEAPGDLVITPTEVSNQLSNGFTLLRVL